METITIPADHYDKLRTLLEWRDNTPEELELPDDVPEFIRQRAAGLLPDMGDESTWVYFELLSGAIVAQLLVSPDPGPGTVGSDYLIYRQE